MSVNLREFEARLRQLYALDRNAAEMYASISALAPDQETKVVVDGLAREEAQHMLLSKQILKLLGCE